MKAILAIAAAGLAALLAASPANAVLMITMTDSTGGSFHCVDNAGGCDFSGAGDNLLTIDNTVGAFHVQGTISTSTSGLANILTMLNFGATNTTGAGATLNMWVSDTDFAGPVTGIAGSSAILFGNAIGSGQSSLEFWADPNNQQGANPTNAPGVFLFGATATPTTDPQSFDGNDAAAFIAAGLFSMTEVAHINLIGGGNFTGFEQNMQSAAAPIPAALPLMGSVIAGIGGLSAWKRRRKIGSDAQAAV
jgi:hypothetical protein